jgi:hypothetical protein
VRRALQRRAGVRAEVVVGGVMRVGDPIREIEDEERPARG